MRDRAAVTAGGEAPDERSLAVRVLATVHRGLAPHRQRPVLRWVLTRLGRSPQRSTSATRCRQCGEWAWVAVLRLGVRRARYWCQRCGAVVSVTDLSQIRPAAALRTAPTSAPAPRVAAPPELDEVMPADMRRWVVARSRRPLTAGALDKAAIYQLYRQWDAQTPRGLPAFSTVVGALHDACYRSELVVRALESSADDNALFERAEHARRWLARNPASLCWIVNRVPPDGLATPDPAAVRVAAKALRAGQEPDAETGRAARAALFGTDGGPTLRTLLAVFPAADMVSALDGYLATGARPLRDDVLARLAAPLADRISR